MSTIKNPVELVTLKIANHDDKKFVILEHDIAGTKFGDAITGPRKTVMSFEINDLETYLTDIVDALNDADGGKRSFTK
ncbi:hypothetical protein [Lelliottia nimipressuralis]|uniref:hypothetical protein n=1 Tax=Lelliottia nimipressuralis TaxID=69220 RepID=UPI00289E672F|nr:hypothetical protein [Lelliottia nimipressuralis]